MPNFQWNEKTGLFEDKGNQQSTTETANIAVREARNTNPVSSLKNQLMQAITAEVTTPYDPANEREAITSLFDARLKEIDRQVAEESKKEAEAGRIAEAQAGGINIRAGLAGSPFASARIEGVRTKTRQTQQSIQEKGNLQKQAVYSEQEQALSNIEARANQRRQERLGLLQTGINLVEGEQEKAMTDFTTLAKGGTSWEDAEKIPDFVSEMEAQTGKSKDYLKFIYTANLPKDQYTEPNYHWEGGDLVAISFDKNTGKTSTQTFSAEELGITPEAKVKTIVNENTGEVYWYDENEIANGQATLNKLGNVGMMRAPKDSEITGADKASELKDSALTSAKELLEKFKTNKWAVGKSSLLPVMPGSAAADFVVQFNNLKSLLSLDNVKYLKGQGQVSDAERRLLEQASAKLDRSQSENEFQKSLNEIIQALSGAGDNNQAQPGEIMVKDKATGQLGYIPENEYDPNIYEKQ